MLRNLLYNCCPIKGSEHVTRDNIEHLCKYGKIFNGRKIVLIKTGEIMEDPNDVRPLFGSLGDIEFVLWPNDPVLHEVAGFIETLEKLESKRSDEATFYAHTKGVSHTKSVSQKIKKTESPEVYRIAVRQWRRRMYSDCLRYPERIDEILKSYSACGSYLISTVQRVTPRAYANWIFAGTFFWIKHSVFFSHPKWKEIRQDNYGIEDFLGDLFPYGSVCDLNRCPPLHNPIANIYIHPFGLFFCKQCKKEVNIQTIPKRIVCPKCGAKNKGRLGHQRNNLTFIRHSDMFY